MKDRNERQKEIRIKKDTKDRKKEPKCYKGG